MFFLAVIPSLHSSTAKASDETISMQAADNSINIAFTNVLAAEKAGGNVTQLLARLSNAGQLLAEAQNEYNNGNLANVNSLAGKASLLANQVNGNAISLRNISVTNSENNFLSTAFFSLAAILTLTVILFFTWRRFRRGYNLKLLGMKPEVGNNTT